MSELNKKSIMKENGGFNGHFLTLAPPIPKDPPSYLDPCIRELPDFDALPYQVDIVTLPMLWFIAYTRILAAQFISSRRTRIITNSVSISGSTG